MDIPPALASVFEILFLGGPSFILLYVIISCGGIHNPVSMLLETKNLGDFLTILLLEFLLWVMFFTGLVLGIAAIGKALALIT